MEMERAIHTVCENQGKGTSSSTIYNTYSYDLRSQNVKLKCKSCIFSVWDCLNDGRLNGLDGFIKSEILQHFFYYFQTKMFSVIQFLIFPSHLEAYFSY